MQIAAFGDTMGAFDKLAPVGVWGGDTFALGCMLDIGLVACGRDKLPFGGLLLLLLFEYASGETYGLSLCLKKLKIKRHR